MWDKFKAIGGGAPVTSRWSKRIGADAYTEDARDGILKSRELLEQAHAIPEAHQVPSLPQDVARELSRIAKSVE